VAQPAEGRRLPVRPPAGQTRAASAPESGLIGDILLTEADIQRRVAELAKDIDHDYQGSELLLVSVLKGALFFLVDLARALTTPVQLDFLAITAYGEPVSAAPGSSGSTGTVRFLKDLDASIENRHVLIVEDIIDTGLTLHYILRTLRLRGPASVEVCTLLDRPYRRLVDIEVRYRGFTVPDDFFVGYGFDYRQLYRNLPHLAHLRV
jgi:hypoxanthine phosphoribosyltransferase